MALLPAPLAASRDLTVSRHLSFIVGRWLDADNGSQLEPGTQTVRAVASFNPFPLRCKAHCFIRSRSFA